MGKLYAFVAGESLASVKEAWLLALANQTRIRQANESDHDAWPNYHGPGGLHRLAVMVNVTKPGSGWQVVCVDSEVDWRDRLLMVWSADSSLLIAQASVFPGNEDENIQHLDIDLHYTNTGISDAQGVSGRHLRLDSDHLLLYARDSDGALMMQRSASDSYSLPRTVILRIWATERLGERGALGTSVPAFAAIDGNPIDPHDLNNVQDTGMLEQVRRGTSGSSETCDAMPLGPFTHGSPRVPHVWYVKDSTGKEVETRQRVADAVRRAFSIAIADNDTKVIDDSVDWRDRFVWGHGRWSASDIRPGQASDTGHNAADPWFLPSMYLGPGEDGATGFSTASYYMILEVGEALVLFADESTGELKIHNRSGGDRYVTGWIEGSFQLGPRRPIE